VLVSLEGDRDQSLPVDIQYLPQESLDESIERFFLNLDGMDKEGNQFIEGLKFDHPIRI